jgi:hypothetical protein
MEAIHKKKVWHICETPDKIEIHFVSDDGSDKVEIYKDGPEFEKKIKEYAKEHEMVRKHFKIHHEKDILKE